MNSTRCNECEASLEIGADVVLAEVIQCAECGIELEVTNLDPLALDLAPEVEEDWGE
ncbi:MAG: lysine biosynthesis protein LysW [Myxococcota bacterium]|nr:lysine biosynthesis protein LysW [Myxococcota bacterium]